MNDNVPREVRDVHVQIMIIYASTRSEINMEGNKDEAKKCLEIARRYLVKGDKEKARKFIGKSQKLYPLKEAESKCFNLFILYDF